SPLDFADEAEASGQETAAPEVPPPEEVPISTVPGGDQAAPVAVLLLSRTRDLKMSPPLLKLGPRGAYTGQNEVSPTVVYSTPPRPVKTLWIMLLLRATFLSCAI
nr:hypothetical protein [Tanacetum cinerariifolium]